MSGDTEAGGAHVNRTAVGNDPPDGTETPGDSGGKLRGKPGRKPRGTVPAPVPDLPDQPDPDHVLT